LLAEMVSIELNSVRETGRLAVLYRVMIAAERSRAAICSLGRSRRYRSLSRLLRSIRSGAGIDEDAVDISRINCATSPTGTETGFELAVVMYALTQPNSSTIRSNVGISPDALGLREKCSLCESNRAVKHSSTSLVTVSCTTFIPPFRSGNEPVFVAQSCNKT